MGGASVTRLPGDAHVFVAPKGSLNSAHVHIRVKDRESFEQAQREPSPSKN